MEGVRKRYENSMWFHDMRMAAEACLNTMLLSNMGSLHYSNVRCIMPYKCISKSFQCGQVRKEYTAPGAVRVREILTYTANVVTSFCYRLLSPMSEECVVYCRGMMAPR